MQQGKKCRTYILTEQFVPVLFNATYTKGIQVSEELQALRLVERACLLSP